MWDKSIKKTIFTLDIDNAYSKELTDLTYPLMKEYARKIDAEFVIISKRKFPDWPVTYEKFQVYELSQKMNNDWNIFFDCDTLIHPDTPDLTQMIPFDTVCHNGHDYAPIRWKYDRFFERDGRHIGSCTWCVINSRLNLEIWKPINDLTQEEIAERIFPVVGELLGGIEPIRLIDDYVCSRNIAKYGLKYKDLIQIFQENNLEGFNFFHHTYNVTIREKINHMRESLQNWRLL